MRMKQLEWSHSHEVGSQEWPQGGRFESDGQRASMRDITGTDWSTVQLGCMCPAFSALQAV